VLICVGCVSVR